MAAIFGRSREVGWLRGLRSRQSGRIVVVYGEAGVGKTSLVEAAFPAAERTASVSFPAARLALPGYGLRHLAAATGAEGRVLADAIERDSAERGVDTAAVWRAADSLVQTIESPLICFDDAQWADDLTLSWLSRVADVLATTPATLVLVARGADAMPPRLLAALSAALRARIVSSLQVKPLDEEAVLQMVRAAQVEDPGEVARRLHVRTDGVPLAVEALLDEIARGREAGLSESLPEHAAPLVLRAVVGEQVDGLSNAARAIVTVLAIAPLPVTVDVLAELAGMSRAAVETALDEATQSGLVVRLAGAITFRHDLQREAVADLVPPGRKRTLHGEIGDALARRPGWPATLVAQQYIAAGRAKAAIEWLRRAAAEAVALHDHGNAYAQLEDAADLERDPAARTELVETAFNAARSSDRCDSCVELITRVLGDLRSPDQRGRLLLKRARLHAYLGNALQRDGDLRASHDAFAQSDDPCGRARALTELALPAGSQPTAAMTAAGAEALDLARRCGDRSLIAIAATNLALAKLFAGDPGGMDDWEEAARAAPAEEMAHGSEEAFRTHFNWATTIVAWGDYRRAGSLVATGLRYARELNHIEAFEAIDLELAWRTGRWHAALDVIRRAQSRWVRTECVPVAEVIRIAITFERERRPDVGGLGRARDDLLRLTPEDWGPMAQAIAMRIRGERSEPSPERGLTEVLETVRSMGLRIGWDEVVSTAADVQPHAARRALAALDGLRPTGPRADAALALAEGALSLDAGRYAEAAERLEDAAARFEALPEPWRQGRCFELAAEALQALGFKTGPFRRAAAELYSELGAERSLARVVRRGGGTRALSGFHIPRLQSYAPHPGLTARESEVADLARRGFTAVEIAQHLGISPATAKKHIESVKAKLGVRKKSELVRALLET